MEVGAAAGVSMVMECEVNVYGLPPPTGVAVMMMPGLVVEPATPVTIAVFPTANTVAMPGSSAWKVKVASMTVPFWPVLAVAKSWVWKPAGKLVDDEEMSSHAMSGGATTS